MATSTVYVPIGNAPAKVAGWQKQGARIAYLTSRTDLAEVDQITRLLRTHGFPSGDLYYRKMDEQYKQHGAFSWCELLTTDVKAAKTLDGAVPLR